MIAITISLFALLVFLVVVAKDTKTFPMDLRPGTQPHPKDVLDIINLPRKPSEW